MPNNTNYPKIMGILNVTDDSFYDGGKFFQKDVALRQANQMITEGAAIIDVGGESTRPGAQSISTQQELNRVLPVIEALRLETDIPISIDTSKALVMSAAVEMGASLINDVRALQEPDTLATAAACQVPVCLMHMQGSPRSMQENPRYDNLIADIHAFLAERITSCEEAGIARDQIILDPGFGFGKTVQHNLQLIRELHKFSDFGLPLLIGVSRKSTIGKLLDIPIDERLAGSLALSALAVYNGASIIRSHDVKATLEAIRITQAVKTGIEA